LNLDNLQKLVFEECCKNGYTEMWNKAGKIGDIAEMGLVNTEVSEALEELRKKEVDENQLAEECANIIIRVLNFMSRKGLDADIAIFSKHQKNMTRGYLHGKGV